MTEESIVALDPIYFGVRAENHTKQVDLFSVTRYNAIAREMSDVCWTCTHGPMRYSPRCRKCVKVFLNKTLPKPESKLNPEREEEEDE